MNRGQLNNNPVNLRFARQRESTGPDDKGFAIFPTAEAGWRAALRQILLDAERGLTLREYIYKFAPPNENDTEGYLAYVCKQTSLPSDYRLGAESMGNLVEVIEAQAHMEGWFAK